MHTRSIAPQSRPVNITAVVPCFNRPDDLLALIGDLATLHTPNINLRIVIVDNDSTTPLQSLIPIPEHLDAHFLRLPTNTGGSGGYNAGISHALSSFPKHNPHPPHYIWLVDSDARVNQDTLSTLTHTLNNHPHLAAAGPAIADPASGTVFEVGGTINKTTGCFSPLYTTTKNKSPLIPCQYVAACCALVRASTIRRTGLMPDVFLNGDDVAWCIRLGGKTTPDSAIAVVPSCQAQHPTFDRFQTWARYYIARNALGPVDTARLKKRVRFIRAMREVARAIQQSMMRRPDLASLHLLGLRDAINKKSLGRADQSTIVFEPFIPLDQLASQLRALKPDRPILIHHDLKLDQQSHSILLQQISDAGLTSTTHPKSQHNQTVQFINALFRSLISKPKTSLAILPAQGRPDCWAFAKTGILCTPQGFIVQKNANPGTLAHSFLVFLQGITLCTRAALKKSNHFTTLPPPCPALKEPTQTDRLTLGVVLLSYNRPEALCNTLRALHEDPALKDAPIIVVDNASTDDTPTRAQAQFPAVRVVRLEHNLGVDAFNLGVDLLDTDVVLILDDDAKPAPGTLDSALQLLCDKPEIAAVTLHPKHPATRQSEWPFAASQTPSSTWPVMGCANLVRIHDWCNAGGYQPDFFLYRNDTDLALTLFDMNRGVWFNPQWIAWHNSPASSTKSNRWFKLATRNWFWLCQRHSLGLTRITSCILGWLWAHKLAAFSLNSHLAVLKGVFSGIFNPPPPLPSSIKPDGSSLARLLKLRFKK